MADNDTQIVSFIRKEDLDTRPAYQKAAEKAKVNIRLEYPYSDKYEYHTRLERLNLDKEREKDIKTGKGFIISAPQGIKKDIKNQDGIYSSRYGSNSMTDSDSFNGLYRCDCGMKRGAINHGEWCDYCQSRVRYVGDDMSITGYLVLKDKYWIIHPNVYRTLEGFIGPLRLNRIIEPKVDVDSDGNVIKNEPVKKDEPFAGIGLLEFKERYEEILAFYLSKYPQKKVFYDDLMNIRDITFTHTISVYTSLLRPSRIDDGSLRYEACNEYFNILASLVHRCNRDRLRMDRKPKEKLKLLYDIQTNLNAVYAEIRDILAKKKGDIRSCIGGRYAYSSRAVIRQDVDLMADQVRLPFHALCKLLQQVIINVLVRSYNFTYAQAYRKWFKAQITGNDPVVYNIIDGLIKDSDRGGLPVLINRNPTIAYGGVLSVKCIGINMDYTMSLSLLVLKLLAADFDGDTLNILYMYNKDFIEMADAVLSPRAMIISRNDGRLNDDMLFSRDVLINANALKGLAEYTDEEMSRIEMLQNME